MVGANPNTCSGSACDVTIQADITPIIVNVGGLTFDGNDVPAATLASPQFATNNYGSTPCRNDRATAPNAGSRGAGGALSPGDAGLPLQLQDATQRIQFNKTAAAAPITSGPAPQCAARRDDQRPVEPGHAPSERTRG